MKGDDDMSDKATTLTKQLFVIKSTQTKQVLGAIVFLYEGFPPEVRRVVSADTEAVLTPATGAEPVYINYAARWRRTGGKNKINDRYEWIDLGCGTITYKGAIDFTYNEDIQNYNGFDDLFASLIIQYAVFTIAHQTLFIGGLVGWNIKENAAFNKFDLLMYSDINENIVTIEEVTKYAKELEDCNMSFYENIRL